MLKSGAQGRTSVTPQNGDFSILPAPRRVDRLSDLRAHLQRRAPAFLRPRRLGEDVFALRVVRVDEVFFDVAEQAVYASIRDAGGETIVIRVAVQRKSGLSTFSEGLSATVRSPTKHAVQTEAPAVARWSGLSSFHSIARNARGDS